MKNINVEQFKKILETDKDNASMAFINVCTPEEYAEKHIEGVSSMPLDNLEKNIELLKNKKTIYVHCRSGMRAERAIDIMKKNGIDAEMLNVTGGIMAWEGSGFSTQSLKD
jgi:rhodanese-related sulfurtransferase